MAVIVDLPTPPLPEATQITFLTWASAPSGSLPRPSFCCRPDFSSSLSTSKPTSTPCTPSSSETFWTTACWKWLRIGQPAVVSETITSTLPSSWISIERTMPRSTMFRRSSGSMTALSFSVTCSFVGMPSSYEGASAAAAFAQMKTGPEGPVFEGGEVLLLLARMCCEQTSPGSPPLVGGPG